MMGFMRVKGVSATLIMYLVDFALVLDQDVDVAVVAVDAGPEEDVAAAVVQFGGDETVLAHSQGVPIHRCDSLFWQHRT